jgi:hypothetical protein
MSLVTIGGPKFLGSGTPQTNYAGGGWVIGDGFVLTAAHIVFEWDRLRPGPINIVDNGASNIIDYRGYRALFAAKVDQELTANPTAPRENVDLEAEMTSNDSVVISKSGTTVSATSAGLIGFVAGSTDLPNFKSVLGSTSYLERKTLNSGVDVGDVLSAGSSAFVFSKTSVLGDSGGAYLINSDGREYVLGTQSAALGTTRSIGTYFHVSEVNALTISLVTGKSGNISGLEPTNMLIGSASADTILGGERPDIILGRDGADILAGELFANPAIWGNDQLFGGVGDDTLPGGKGSDLLHGGDRKISSQAAGGLNSDGTDTVSYGNLIDGAERKGVIVHLTQGDAPSGYTSFSANPDYQAATFIRDLGRDGGIDTLISVEKIVGTGNDDTFRVDGISTLRFAGSDNEGGLREIDLGAHENTTQQKGDWIDASLCSTALTVDLNPQDAYLCATGDQANTKVKLGGVERITGSTANDVLKGNGSGIIIEGSAGDDEIHLYAGDIGIGSAGSDKFYFYSYKLRPDGSLGEEESLWDNEVLVLGFDQSDEIYIDGVRYTGFSESGTLSGGYYADEVGAWVYDYEETKSGPLWGGEGQDFYFGTTSYFNTSELSSNAGVELNGVFQLNVANSNSRLKINIAGYDPLEGGIVFDLACNYTDPPYYGNYIQKVGQSNGYNIDDPQRYGHNPDATWEDLRLMTFDLQDWAPALPTDLNNYAGYVGLLG